MLSSDKRVCYQMEARGLEQPKSFCQVFFFLSMKGNAVSDRQPYARRWGHWGEDTSDSGWGLSGQEGQGPALSQSHQLCGHPGKNFRSKKFPFAPPYTQTCIPGPRLLRQMDRQTHADTDNSSPVVSTPNGPPSPSAGKIPPDP